MGCAKPSTRCGLCKAIETVFSPSYAGKGRGIKSTQVLKAGTLLLVSPPLSVLFWEDGDTPENEELAQYMMRRSITEGQKRVRHRLAAQHSELFPLLQLGGLPLRVFNPRMKQQCNSLLVVGLHIVIAL